MIKPKCDICKKELDNFGGLIFSPPNVDGKVDKFHVCKDCFEKLKEELL